MNIDDLKNKMMKDDIKETNLNLNTISIDDLKKSGQLQGNFSLGKISLDEIFRPSIDAITNEISRISSGQIEMRDVVTIGFTLFLVFLVTYFLFSPGPNSTDGAESISKEEEEEKEPLRDFTLEQLRDFNGENDKPIYISLKKEVYDVSKARDFYGAGNSYHCFAGREASRAMAKFSFDEEDLSNPDILDLGPFEREQLEGWVDKFKHYKGYPIVGRVSVPHKPRKFTRSELAAYNGKQELPAERIDVPIYIGINGKVIDVSYGGREMYAEGGPYNLFAGKDVSRALAKMSFKEEDVSSSDISDLTEEQRKTLHEWETKFIDARKYPIVGTLVN